MNQYKKLLSNTVIFAIGTFSSKLLVFLLVPLYTRFLTNQEYGTVDLIMQTGNLLLPLVSLGIINGIVRFGLDKGYRKSDVFSTGLYTILGGFGILLLLAPLLSRFRYIQGHTVLVYVFVLMSSMRSLCSQFVRAKGYVRLYAFDGILSTLTTILFNVLYLVVLKLGVLGYMLAVVCSDFLSVVFLAVSARLWRHLRFFTLRRSTSVAMLRYSVPLIPNTMFWWITNVSDRYLIAELLTNGTAANGLYAVAYKTPTIINLVAGIFMDAWQMTAVGEAHNKKKEAFFSKVFFNYQSLIFTAASGLILFSKVITLMLASKAFYDSWRYIPLLMLATSYSCMVSFLGSIYMVEKKSVMNLLTTAAGAGINVGMNLWLIPKYGVNGAAFATFVSYFAVFLLRVMDTRRYLEIRWNTSRLAVNTGILLLQTAVILSEKPYWVVPEVLLCGLMVLLNMASIWRSVKKILISKLSARRRAA